MEKRDKIFFGIIFVLLLLVGYLVYYMAGEGGECIKNPYVYGASNMKDVSCSCMQFREDASCPAYFSFNDTAIETQITKCGSGNIGLVQIANLNFDVTP